MHVLIVACVFPPEPVVSSRTSSDIAHELVTRGHGVTVIAPFPSRPGGATYEGYSRRLFQRERDCTGLHLVRCFSTLSRSSRVPSRLLENLSFGLTGAVAALAVQRPGVIYSNTWPIFASCLVAAVAWLRRVPFVMSVQDLYPESLLSQGRLRPNGLVTRLLRWVDGAIARRCHALIVISDRFAATYASGRHVPVERLHIIPNWGNPCPAFAAKEELAVREERGLAEDAFLAVYSGNIGAAAGLESVIEAMTFLADLEHCYLLIAGDGSRLDACKALVKKRDIRRTLFYSPYPREDTARVLAAANVLLLPTHGQQSLASMPSKAVDYMLSGRPILAAVDPESDLARLIERSGCGWIVPPGRSDLLASKLKDLVLADRMELVRRGQLGQDYALRNLTREVCLPRVIAVLEAAAEARQR